MMTAPAQATTQVGSVAIYSDGRVEKLIEIGPDWTIWEDQRKRLYKKVNYPHFPIIHYQKYPEKNEGYQQKLIYGSPGKLKPLGNEVTVNYELLKTSKNSKNTKYWECSYAGEGLFRVDSKKYSTDNYECTRFSVKKDISSSLKEQLNLKYAADLGLVVYKQRISFLGKKQRAKLVKVLEPERATAKRISRIVYKLRNSK